MTNPTGGQDHDRDNDGVDDRVENAADAVADAVTGSDPSVSKSGARVLLMNTQSSTNYDHIPLPARQQLGDHGRLRDARSGNGVYDQLGAPTQGSGQIGPNEVTYHLDSTPPPAEPGDAPGTPGAARARAVDDGSQPGTTRDRFGYRQNGSWNDKSRMRTQPGRDERIMNERGDHEEEVKDIADGGTAGHKMMPQGFSQSADAQHGVFDGSRRSDEQSSERNPSAGGDMSGASDEERSAFASSTPSDTGSTSNNSASGEDDVPSGSTSEVLAWVGNDQSRAQKALDAEQAKEKPRSGLIRELNEKLGN